MFKHVYVWDIPVRVSHWTHVASVAVLAITGYYIGNPFIVAPHDATQAYVMGWIRTVHFVASFFFSLGYLVRGYWSIFGNHYAGWRYWLPTTRERRIFLWKQLRYYFFVQRERPSHIGHNPAAGLAYTGLGFVILLQSLTGYALYAETHAGGFWQITFGWLLTLFGNQTLRIVHHMLMWFFGAFFIAHLYMAILSDFEAGDASIASIISGIKFERVQQEEG